MVRRNENFTKVFDQLSRKATEWTLIRQDIPERLITLVMYLYKDPKTKVCDAGGTLDLSNMKGGVLQRSNLSPLL